MERKDVPQGKFPELNYAGSFQDRRFIIRTGDQLSAAWREVERMGTVEGLMQIAGKTGQGIEDARLGSLRIRQAVELRLASADTSPLTRPLLLYYSALNLVRGWQSVQKGGMGKPRHGASFKKGDSLLECGLRLEKEGTLPQLLAYYNSTLLEVSELSLRDCLTQIPELKRDIKLLPGTTSQVAWVEVKGVINGPTALRFHIDQCTAEEFAASWQQLLPWFKDACVLSKEGPFVLEAKAAHQNRAQITEFCESHLMCDLHLNDNAVWFDHVARATPLLPGRLPAYVFALFILSNVCRYEPQYFETAFAESTNLAFVLTNALSCAERYIPQLFASAAYGSTVYFE
jgi:hypothetical protein